MINTLEIFLRDHLYLHAILIAMTVAAMLAAMFVDLIFGVRKAKEIHQATTSTGLKKTCDKARKYLSPFMVLVFIDLITCVIIPFPVFSMTWAAYCVFCEFKSVREKSWEKAELRKAEKTMNIIIENKDDIAKVVVGLLTEKNNKSKRHARNQRNNNPL